MDLKGIVSKEVNEILELLQDWDSISQQPNVNHIALVSGLPSIILVLIDCHLKSPDMVKKEKIIQYIMHSFDVLENTDKILPSYCSGFAGYGFFLLKLKKTSFFLTYFNKEIIDHVNEILEQIDEILEEQIDVDFFDENYDILHGVVGIGLYFLERNKINLVNKIIDDLEKTSFKNENQVFWKKYQKYKLHTSVIDMGNAHGNASIIYFLSKVISKTTLNEKNRETIHHAINFHLKNAQTLDDKILTYFPHQIVASEFEKGIHKPQNSRLAWCYGDLGTLYTLLLASDQINEPTLYDQVLTKLRDVAKRINETEYFEIDAGFCHGSSGIAIIFKNIYSLTNEKNFLDASEYWIKETLKFKFKDIHNESVAGYNLPIKDFNEQSITLLEGLSGILFCYSKFLFDEMPLTEETLFLKF